MATLIDLRRRIRSVKNTRQLTKAMKSVSAAKLKRAQNQVYQTRPFSQKLASILSNIRARTPDLKHPFFNEREEKIIDIIIITGDKGLCGAFNSNTLKFAETKVKELKGEEKTVNTIILGKKGYDFLRFKGEEIKDYFIGFFMKLDYLKSVEISDKIISDFLEGKSDAIYMIYNKFHSVSKTEIVFEKLLPIGEMEEIKEEEEMLEYEFEPSPEEIFESLLPTYLKNYFYRILLESAASEHAARMVAMDLATRNASDMIDSLTLTMNKIRQAAITKEILEITTATEAMKK
jgi:F-type H+-transporting ATPase subunit gamma